MATAYICEYTNVEDGVPVVPPIATQAVTPSGSSTQSAAFNAATNYVEITVDGDVAVAFGTNPTAVFDEPDYIPQYHKKLYRVPNDQSFKVAVIGSN